MTRIKPLWNADDQKARLSELTARSDDSAKDRPLRRDVRSLGALLGRVLVEQAGDELFNTIEELRKLMMEYRERARTSISANELMAARRRRFQEWIWHALIRSPKLSQSTSSWRIWQKPTIASAAAAPGSWTSTGRPCPDRFPGLCRA